MQTQQTPRLVPEWIKWAWKKSFGGGDLSQQVVRNIGTEEREK